jgi:hypothetical protein
MAPKLRVQEFLRELRSGRRAFQGQRSRTVRTGGVLGRDNAGVSSDQTGEKPVRRKPKGYWVKLIFPGLVGHKGEAERRS